MSGWSNLNSFRDRRQVAVQLVSCGVLPPGLVQDCSQQSCVITVPTISSMVLLQFIYTRGSGIKYATKVAMRFDKETKQYIKKKRKKKKRRAIKKRR